MRLENHMSSCRRYHFQDNVQQLFQKLLIALGRVLTGLSHAAETASLLQTRLSMIEKRVRNVMRFQTTMDGLT